MCPFSHERLPGVEKISMLPDIQEVMVTPISIVLRVVTGVTIQYMADVSVIWVWLTILFHNYTTK